MVYIIIVLAIALVSVSIHDYFLGKLLDKVSCRYISDRNCLRNFAKVFLAEETKVTKR